MKHPWLWRWAGKHRHIVPAVFSDGIVFFSTAHCACKRGIGTILPTPFARGGNPAAALTGHPWPVWASLFYLSFGAAGVAYLWYSMGIRDVGPCKAAVFINLEPVSAIMLGVLLLGEPLTRPVLMGAGLVIAGVYLVNRPATPENANRSRR